MIMSKHTPGPWRTGTPGRGRFCVYSAAPEAHGVGICVMSNTQKHISPEEVAKYGEHKLNLIADANARLIAAAPEMYEALKLWLTPDASIRHPDNVTRHDKEMLTRAALAKAEGEGEMKTMVEDFTDAVGRAPQDDDLDRAYCGMVGQPGHRMCGWCEDHHKPRLACGCMAPRIEAHDKGFKR